MKLSYLFAALLISAFASGANAANVYVPASTLLNPLSIATVPGEGDYAAASSGSYFSDSVGGYLASNTKITFTYSSVNAIPAFLTVHASGANDSGTNTATSTFVGGNVYSDTTSTLSTLPIIVTANYNAQTGIGTTVIENLSSLVASFTSEFSALIFSSLTNGYLASANVHWVISTVPLPGAALLFGSGLVAMIGVARKRNRR